MGSTEGDKLGLEVRSGHLFLFANSRRNRLKILYWDFYATLAIMGPGDGEPGKSAEPGAQLYKGRSHIREPQETP